MKINIAQMRKELGSTQPFSFKTSAKELDLDKQQGDWTGDIVVEGLIINKGMFFEIAGNVNAQLKQSCSRCLGDMVTLLNVSFEEKYQEANYKESDEVAESDFIYFSGDEIDVTELIRENILLAEPIKPMCSENCRGLCPECGANLNLDTCGCNPIKTDPRLAVLEKLLSKD